MVSGVIPVFLRQSRGTKVGLMPMRPSPPFSTGDPMADSAHPRTLFPGMGRPPLPRSSRPSRRLCPVSSFSGVPRAFEGPLLPLCLRSDFPPLLPASGFPAFPSLAVLPVIPVSAFPLLSTPGSFTSSRSLDLLPRQLRVPSLSHKGLEDAGDVQEYGHL